MITAGQKLKAARLDKKLSLEDVSSATKIKRIFLEHIEAGEYQKLPSDSYAHGFVRNYALFLGLNEKEILAVFRREFDPKNDIKVLPKGFESEEDFSVSGLRLRSRAFIIVGIFILIFGFILFQYRSAFLNPSLSIENPQENATVYSSRIEIEGKTDPDTTVYVDKQEVSVDGKGKFSKIIDVFPGKVIIVIKSINKFQRETQKQLEINVKSGQ